MDTNHPSIMASAAGNTQNSVCSLYPYVTGSSVVAIKYEDGILMAADMGGSYGSTLRYKSVERLNPTGIHSLLGASGEISDFQEILRYLDELIISIKNHHVATGLGNHLATPILCSDRSAVNKIQIAKITEEGAAVFSPFSLKIFSALSASQNPTAGAEGSWLLAGACQMDDSYYS